MTFSTLPKLQRGDRVAVVTPSFWGPSRWPHIYEIGIRRLRDDFGLEPVEFPTTRQRRPSAEERARDLVAAFENPELKAVIATIGGDDMITYAKNLPGEVFRQNAKPFIGFSDNTHFANHLWLNGVPSYYGGCLFTQFALTPEPEPFSYEYLRKALFEGGETDLAASDVYNDIGLNWDDPANATRPRVYEPNEGWYWDGEASGEGVTWGGCIESIDEILRHGVAIPTLEQFSEVVLFAESSEETPSAEYVYRVFRALGERGILGRVRGLLIGRPAAWSFSEPRGAEAKAAYKAAQRVAILREFRKYNPTAPVVQNLDIGHTNPQICLPYGRKIGVDPSAKRIRVEF